MLQIIAHLVGDYVLQTDRMATLKTSQWRWALIHAITYTLPFLFLTHNPYALFVICLTHALIDRYRLARWVVYAKNCAGDWVHRDRYTTPTGYGNETPAFLSTWLLIITDNTMHLLINYLALAWW